MLFLIRIQLHLFKLIRIQLHLFNGWTTDLIPLGLLNTLATCSQISIYDLPDPDPAPSGPDPAPSGITFLPDIVFKDRRILYKCANNYYYYYCLNSLSSLLNKSIQNQCFTVKKLTRNNKAIKIAFTFLVINLSIVINILLPCMGLRGHSLETPQQRRRKNPM